MTAPTGTHPSTPPRRARRRQAGVALLAFTALLVVISSATLLERINAAIDSDVDGWVETAEALAEAKRALIAYAVADANRPGELPCPDFDNDGQATLPDYAGAPCTYPLGWLPTVQLGIDPLRDASGARLWYAVSPAHAAGSTDVLNSELAGAITVDGQSDVVAVVLAPGESFDAQGSRDTANDSRTDAAQFLEGVNVHTDPDPPDAFASAGGTSFNDRLIVITRADLMAGIEQRALGQTARAIARFRDLDGNGTPDTGYPWLAQMAGPTAMSARTDADFKSAIGNITGYLAYLNAGEAFTTSFDAAWDIENVAPSYSSFWTLLSFALMGADFRDDARSFTNQTCTWTGLDELTCTGSMTVATSAGLVCATSFFPDYLNGFLVGVDRTYTLTVTASNASNLANAILAPSGTEFRRRTASIVHAAGDPFPNPGPPTFNLVVTDVVNVGPWAGTNCGSVTITTDNDAYGDIVVANMRHEVTVPDELPAWFVDNGWHKLIGVAIADAEKPGGAGCIAGTDCLGVTGLAPGDDKQAVLISAGAAIDVSGVLEQDRTAYTPGAYFEQDNVDADTQFEMANAANPFNDRVRALAP